MKRLNFTKNTFIYLLVLITYMFLVWGYTAGKEDKDREVTNSERLVEQK